MLRYLLAFFVFQLPLFASRYIDLSHSGVSAEPPKSQQFLVKSKGAELQKWSVMFHSHGTHKTPAGIEAKKYSKKTITPNGVKFTTTTELAKLKVNGAHIYFSARIYSVFKVTPDMAGKKLVARFKIRGKRYDAPTQNHLFANISFPGAGVKDAVIRPAVTPEFTTYSVSAIVPAKAKQAVVCAALYGCGELEVSEAEASIVPIEAANGDVIVTSSGFTDQ